MCVDDALAAAVLGCFVGVLAMCALIWGHRRDDDVD